MRYLGIDFGLRRVGLATSEGNLSAPFKTLEVKNFKDAFEQVTQIIARENFDKVVIGLPEGKIGQTVLGFIKALEKVGLVVEAADETLSSQKAIKQMLELSIPKDKRKINDAYSAAIILQDFLDSQI